MSNIYVLEPPTKGKVVLSTSVGDIDIELWPKEAPKAVRNFVQLCLDGYYNGTIFHRIVKGFMAQGGDRTKTGTGGVSIYGEPFVDEFHTRLKFSHRGLVACANPGQKDSNNSQFFITLDRAEWLDKKNTIFGKVTGDTIYNTIKLGECETDGDDRPIDPPVIFSVEILWNPFDDMIPMSVYEEKKEEESKKEEQKTKVKEKKKLNLLSFGEEAEEEELELKASNIKIKSSHDVLEDSRLLKGEDFAENDEAEKVRRENLKSSVKSALSKGSSKAGDEKQGMGDASVVREDNEGDFDNRMRQKVLEKRKALGFGESHEGSRKPPVSKKEDNGSKAAEDNRADSEEASREEDADISKSDPGEKHVGKLRLPPSQGKPRPDSDAPNVDGESLLTALEQQRERLKLKKREIGDRNKQGLLMMEKFRQTLREAKKKKPAETETETESAAAPEDTEGDWLSNKLKFAPDSSRKDGMSRNEDPNQYILVDPLLEKGKEKFNKQQAKQKKRNREWAGRSMD